MKKIRFIIALTLTLICMLGSSMSAHAYTNTKPYSSTSYSTKKTCSVSGCTRTAVSGESYCGNHRCHKTGCKSKSIAYSNYCAAHTNFSISKDAKKAYYGTSSTKKSSTNSYSSKSKKKTYHDTYDDGYDDVYFDGDYDDDRYRRDPDYARGVDDAMDDEGWDW